MRCFILAVLVCCFDGGLNAASFDCAKARTTAEKLVCSDAGLSKADEEMAARYKRALELASRTSEEEKDLKTNQRVWVRQTGSCGDRSCLVEAYRDRTNFLKYYVYRSNGSSVSVNGTYRMLSLRTCIACFPGKDVTAIILSGQLEVLQQSDGSVKFSLNIINESNLNPGNVEGQIPLKNGIAIYRAVRSADNDDCNLTITFKKTKAIVSQENGRCGFGVGVVADGIYMKAADSVLED
jgi:uncharacterized protein YecT (DUF1311 family)